MPANVRRTYRKCAVALLVFVFAIADVALGPIASQQISRRSGYALSKDECGQAAMAFPKLPIGMRAGYCAGLVASQEDGLVFPRTIVQVPNTELFVVADMGGWSPGKGRLLLLDPIATQGKRIKVLIANLDLPHGLAVGIDGRIYASTVDRIFRFDPLAARPDATVETIVHGLPGLRPVLADGTRLQRNFHPLKHFVFDKTGTLYINIGAPTDSCANNTTQSRPCVAAEGSSPMAAIWAFFPPAGGIFPALKPGDPNPQREVFARGLRNSMALAIHPQFPSEGFPFFQAENARDLPELTRPNEELNLLEKGKFYGWPYCYDLSTPSPEYAALLKASGSLRNICTDRARYTPPLSLLPPHSAPLGMLYYEGSRFSELQGRLVIGLHGYRPTGSRVIYFDVDDKGFPKVSPAPVQYNVSCSAEPSPAFRTEREGLVPAAPFRELIANWHQVDGVRPRGAPVGLAVASDGAIWVVEDKNKTIIRIDLDPTADAYGSFPCNTRSEREIAALLGQVLNDPENRNRLSLVRRSLIEKYCIGCHANFGLKAGQSDQQKDTAVLRFLLGQDQWIKAGDPEAGRLHSRVWGKGPENIMPANGRELIASDPGYRELLMTLDALVSKMVSGERR